MESLDATLIQIVLSYLGNAKDFCSFEKTCKAAKAVLEDDWVWSFCEECKPEDYPDHPYLNRELALIPIALKHCDDWQKGSKRTASVILDVLNVKGWKALVD